MKDIKYALVVLVGIVLFNSCDDNELNPGNPVMNPKTEISSAMFGDSLLFTVNVADAQVPLSTLKAQLFFGDERVSETVIRTKTNDDYSGKIFIPYYANIPNASATLKLILQNINFTITEKEYDLPLTRPDFPYLTFVSDDEEYRMNRVGLYQYSLTKDLPKEIEGYFVAPKVGESGNEIVFGWSNGQITQGTNSKIKFLNAIKGQYSISFNTLTYEGAPFFKFIFNGEAMEQLDEESYTVADDYTKGQAIAVSGIVIDEWNLGGIFTKKSDTELVFALESGKYQIMANFAQKAFSYIEIKDIAVDLTSGSFTGDFVKGQKVLFEGIDNIGDWWIDPDFFRKDGNDYFFDAAFGKYKVTADDANKYFIVEAMRGDALATLQEDGSGAIWIIGEKVGKPSVAVKEVGWDTGKALCMAPLGNGQYRLTVVAGESVNAKEINFKFFHQKGWGGEFGSDQLTTTGDIVFVGNGSNGRDSGNLGINSGKSLTTGKTYEFMIDVSQGINKAVLTVTEK